MDLPGRRGRRGAAPVARLLGLGLACLAAACEPGAVEPADAGPDGEADVGRDGEPDGDEPACLPGELVCSGGAVRRCGADRSPAELVRDCAEPPFESCEIGECTMDEGALGPCCVAPSPFCEARAEVEGKEPRVVEYGGLWDDEGFACAGSVAFDGYNWSLWSRVSACTGPFVRVVLSGYLEGFEPGAAYPLCRQAGALPAIHVTLTADGRSYGNEDPGAGPTGPCPTVSGAVTFHEYGSGPGEPFRVELEGTLLEPGSGETRRLRLESTGSLVRYP